MSTCMIDKDFNGVITRNSLNATDFKYEIVDHTADIVQPHVQVIDIIVTKISNGKSKTYRFSPARDWIRDWTVEFDADIKSGFFK